MYVDLFLFNVYETDNFNQKPSLAKRSGVGKPATGTSILLLKKGEDAPKTRRLTFRRDEKFEIVASYDDSVTESMLSKYQSRTIGKFQISGMPKNAASSGKIQVDFTYNKSGIFNVSSSQYLETVEEPAAAASAEGADKVCVYRRNRFIYCLLFDKKKIFHVNTNFKHSISFRMPLME
jgi:hypothetical protein